MSKDNYKGGVRSESSERFMAGLVFAVFMFVKACVGLPILLLSAPAWPAVYVYYRRGFSFCDHGEQERWPVPPLATPFEKAAIVAGRPFLTLFEAGATITLGCPCIA